MREKNNNHRNFLATTRYLQPQKQTPQQSFFYPNNPTTAPPKSCPQEPLLSTTPKASPTGPELKPETASTGHYKSQLRRPVLLMLQLLIAQSQKARRARASSPCSRNGRRCMTEK